jgi:type IV pilus assembly protein PilX
MNKHTRRARGLPRMPRSQRGTMLIIALIVLVAMTLAGIATMRSVDTATVMAGNIAFRQSALNAADQGIQAGFALLRTPTGNPLADPNQDFMGPAAKVAGYYSNTQGNEPNWADPATWTSSARPAVQLNSGVPDAAGNVIWFIVERLCQIPNCKVGETCGGIVNLCGSTPSSGALSREGEDNFRITPPMQALPQVHYRITARAVGPRNSIAIVQTLVR